MQSDLGAISDAASRAAELTRQLLTFSRRQILDAQVLDLNQVVRTMEPMLQPLLGEQIALHIELGDKIGSIRLNRGQMEQVIMNLCCNARDAITGPGKIVLRTSDEQRIEDARFAGSTPLGHYACLTVVDTGSDMDATTKQHLFEPFFTTKERGRGTGLGLSIVQGIVGQNGGFISVSSELGRGTEFRVYLPAVQDAVDAVPLVAHRAAPRPGERPRSSRSRAE